MSTATSEIVIKQAKLDGISNSIPNDVSFDYADFENDVGGATSYSRTLNTGYVINYESGKGFSIKHPQKSGVIDVNDVLEAYKDLYHSHQVTAYTSYISDSYLVQFSPWQSNVFKKITEFADSDSDSGKSNAPNS